MPRLNRRQIGSVVFYQSPQLAALNVPHAFTTRLAGVSKPPYHWLNLGNPGDCEPSLRDPQSNLDENFQLAQQAIGCDGYAMRWLRQVHGCDVCVVDTSHDTAEPAPAADAVVTHKQPGIMVGVRVADCVPILLTNAADNIRRPGSVVAAVHAGWRGIVSKVIDATLHTLSHQFDLRPQDLVSAVGPCISASHFEVGDEVAHEFDRANLSNAVRREPGRKPHIDLAGAAHQQLLNAGVLESHIDITDRCTFRDADEFFSHRREQGKTGRMAALIAPSVD